MTDPVAHPTVPGDLRAMMRGFPTGVAVVTSTDLDGRPRGMTCSAVCSVTLDPPTLLVSLRAASPTLAAILARGLFAVNLLHEDARGTAALFASGDPARFDRVAWRMDRGAAGPHLHEAAHAVADCRVDTTVPVGDHVLVIGRSLAVTREGPCLPLLYGLGRYGRWTGTGAAG